MLSRCSYSSQLPTTRGLGATRARPDRISPCKSKANSSGNDLNREKKSSSSEDSSRWYTTNGHGIELEYNNPKTDIMKGLKKAYTAALVRQTMNLSEPGCERAIEEENVLLNGLKKAYAAAALESQTTTEVSKPRPWNWKGCLHDKIEGETDVTEGLGKADSASQSPSFSKTASLEYDGNRTAGIPWTASSDIAGKKWSDIAGKKWWWCPTCDGPLPICNAAAVHSTEKKAPTCQVDVDVDENPESYSLWLDVPGSQKSDVKVEVSPSMRTMIISGERKRAESTGAPRRRERKMGTFSRTVKLAKDLDASTIVAKVDRGVLHVTAQKFPAVEPVDDSVEISID